MGERANHNPRVIIVILVCLSLLLLQSCTAENRLPGYVYYRLSSNPTTLDPALITDVNGGSIAAKLFNGLVRLDADMKIIPDLASSFYVSPDGLTYKFVLRDDVRFSNDRELTANDVKYSFERLLAPDTRSPNTWVLDRIAGAGEFMEGKAEGIDGITVINDYELTIMLERPFSPFLSLLTMTAAYVVPREDVERWGADFSEHAVGTGPFVIERWEPGKELILKRNDYYFSDIAKVKGIAYRVIPEDLTAVAEFELGNLDVITVPASVYSRYRDNPKWKDSLHSIKGLNTYYLGFNCSRPPFDDPELRRAVSEAIDTRRILDTFYEGRGRPAMGPVPDVLRDWPPPEPYSYNPGDARKIIEGKAIADREIEFYVTAQEDVADMAEIIQSYLAEAGLKVSIKQLEWSAYKDAINRGEPDLFWLSWWADYPDPENFLFPLFDSSNLGPAGNRSRYVNKEVDRLIEAGQHAPDIAERDRDYSEAERIIVHDAPWVFFWHRTDYTLSGKNVKGYYLYPIYSMDKGTEIEI